MDNILKMLEDSIRKFEEVSYDRGSLESQEVKLFLSYWKEFIMMAIKDRETLWEEKIKIKQIEIQGISEKVEVQKADIVELHGKIKELEKTIDQQHAESKRLSVLIEDNLRAEYQVRLDKVKEVKHKHGEFKNVLLTDTELEKLKKDFPDKWEEMIKNLDEYIEMKGSKYKNHNLVMRKWKSGESKSQKTERPYVRLDDI